MDLRVEGGADDLVVVRVGRRACSRDDVEACDALRVCYSVILPRRECFAVQRTFQNPVSRPRRVCGLQDHISDLEDLCERRTWRRTYTSTDIHTVYISAPAFFEYESDTKQHYAKINMIRLSHNG